jgi:hypothetical protein
MAGTLLAGSEASNAPPWEDSGLPAHALCIAESKPANAIINAAERPHSLQKYEDAMRT